MRLILLLGLVGGLMVAEPEVKLRPLPGMLQVADLVGYDALGPERQSFVRVGLEEAARLKLNRYLFGSADPASGGFDCSGSMFYLLQMVGVDPPRTSAGLYDWIREAGNLHTAAVGALDLDDPSFADLLPGDLLFWSGTYVINDGRKSKISHVQMFLGREKDGRAVMLGSTDGRSYRGEQRCGFGVFDFKLPRAGSKSKFVGYGRPPGLMVLVRIVGRLGLD